MKYITLPIFIYGTMRKATGKWSMLQEPNALFMQNAVMQGSLYETDRGWPAYVAPKTSHIGAFSFVAGEMWLVTFDLLRQIDTMEGFRVPTGWFDRIMMPAVGCGDGKAEVCWVYVWKQSFQQLGRFVVGGDWCNG